MVKRTKAKPPLTVPRYTLQTKKVPRKEALRRKNARIQEAQEDLKRAMAAHLEKTEQVYVKHRPGSKKWNNAYFEPTFPLICSPEVSRLILEAAKKK